MSECFNGNVGRIDLGSKLLKQNCDSWTFYMFSFQDYNHVHSWKKVKQHWSPGLYPKHWCSTAGYYWHRGLSTNSKTHYKWYCKVYFERLAEAVGDYILTLLVKEMLTQSHDGRSKENSLTGSQAVNRTELEAARLRYSQHVFFKFQQNDIYSKYC